MYYRWIKIILQVSCLLYVALSFGFVNLLMSTRMIGPLPENWSNLVNLTRLTLGSNQLSGELIWDKQWQLTWWRNIYSICLCVCMAVCLSLFIAWFCGHIWHWLIVVLLWFSLLTLLRFVTLVILGPLPTAWSSLTALNYLELKDNQLTGEWTDEYLHFITLDAMNMI